MVNLDPDTARPAPEVMKAVVRANQNTAGIYSAVTLIGRLVVGQTKLCATICNPLRMECTSTSWTKPATSLSEPRTDRTTLA
jgi:hypothetical protein